MNNRDRRLLERVDACLTVPFAAFGTQSSTTAGISRFHNDMQHALPAARMLIRWIAAGEPYAGAIDEELDRLEIWHSNRKSDNWK